MNLSTSSVGSSKQVEGMQPLSEDCSQLQYVLSLMIDLAFFKFGLISLARKPGVLSVDVVF